jgi:hypothetical protein
MVALSQRKVHLIAQNMGSNDLGLWASPSVDGLVDIIAKIPDCYEDVLKRGKLCANWVRENETYDLCAQRLLDEIS